MTDTEGKIVVLALRHEDERQAISELLEELKMIVYHADSGRTAIHLFEDHKCDFLITDIQLTDMHAWSMLGTLKESIRLSDLPVVMIMDEQTVIPLENITPVVRPVAMARLRHIITGLFTDEDSHLSIL